MADEEVDDETACAYWEHARLAHSMERRERLDARDLGWADERVTRAISRGGRDALDALVVLAGAASTEQLGALGAGPLEDVLYEHGEALLDELDDVIRRTPRLRAALSAVWWGEIPDVVVNRLSRLVAP